MTCLIMIVYSFWNAYININQNKQSNFFLFYAFSLYLK